MTAAAIQIVNAAALAVFLMLLGATLFSMARRLLLYRVARKPAPVLLKRGVVLFAALGIIGGELLVLRILGITFEPESIERLVFLIQSNLILLGAMAYYAKVELFDIDDPGKD